MSFLGRHWFLGISNVVPRQVSRPCVGLASWRSCEIRPLSDAGLLLPQFTAPASLACFSVLEGPPGFSVLEHPPGFSQGFSWRWTGSCGGRLPAGSSLSVLLVTSLI